MKGRDASRSGSLGCGQWSDEIWRNGERALRTRAGRSPHDDDDDDRGEATGGVCSCWKRGAGAVNSRVCMDGGFCIWGIGGKSSKSTLNRVTDRGV